MRTEKESPTKHRKKQRKYYPCRTCGRPMFRDYISCGACFAAPTTTQTEQF